MVGVMVPISVEGGRQDRSRGFGQQRDANNTRRSSCTTSFVKPLLKKNSRTRLKTLQVAIQVEGHDDAQQKPQLVKRGSTTKLVLPWFPTVVEQAHVQPSRRQSGLAARELNKADLNLVDLNRRAELSQPASLEGSRNPLEGGRRALVELNSEEVNRRAAGSGFNQFQLDALAEHNVCRARHGVNLLELREELCVAAQEYADKLAASGNFEHSGDQRYGENLYWGWSSLPGWVPKGTEAVTSWYAEGKTYDFSREPPMDTPAGHFTQMVWAGSSAMGVGLAAAADRPGKWIVVVKYDPPGNWLGRYMANVRPPGRR